MKKKSKKINLPKAIVSKPRLVVLLALVGGSISAYYKVAYPSNIIFKCSFSFFIVIGSLGLLAWREK